MLRFLPFVPPVLSLLWALVCLRIYTMISRDNVWQRRSIAIGAGLGAALIYLLASTFISVLQSPDSEPEEPLRFRVNEPSTRGQ